MQFRLRVSWRPHYLWFAWRYPWVVQGFHSRVDDSADKITVQFVKDPLSAIIRSPFSVLCISHSMFWICRWKYDGPSDSFKALIDMAAVHSSCRLCIHVATKIHEKEERTPKFMNRPCSCSSKRGKVYHLFVRERGRFKTESIFLRYGINYCYIYLC